MSSAHESQHPGHVHGSHAALADLPHATLGGYLKGFVLASILTIIPFWLVMGHVLKSDTATILIVMVLGAAQIVVHIIYFLHMNTSSEGGWNMIALIFTLTLLVIMLGASVWVVVEEDHLMMSHAVLTSQTQGPSQTQSEALQSMSQMQ